MSIVLFRAPSLKELEEFKTKAECCFRAAAEATGEATQMCVCVQKRLSFKIPKP